MKLNRWYLFLTHLYNFKDTVVRIVKSNAFNVSLIIILVMFSMFVGFMFKYNEIKAELTWQHYLQVSKEEAKQQSIDKQVRYIMSLYGSDSLIIHDEIMKTENPVLTATVIAIESEYNPKAISVAGAEGLMQVMPYHFKYNERWDDPVTNIRVGSRILHEYSQMFNGDPKLTIAAFNAGPDAVIKAGYKVPQNTKTGETVPYTKRGIAMLDRVQSMR